MIAANDTLADSLRHRAFRSRDPGTARKLLALADEAGTIHVAPAPAARR